MKKLFLVYHQPRLEQLPDIMIQVGIVECLLDLRLAFFFVKEKHLVLLPFLVRVASHIDGLHRVGVDTRIVAFGAERHRRRRKVLNLL